MIRQRGFSYVIVMFLVAIVAIISARAMGNTLTAERRAKEDELLWVGQAYRHAIQAYYDGSPGTAKVYPKQLKDLLLDGRGTLIRRPLRALYRDPISGSRDWGLVKTEAGDLIGVYSLSTLKPLKRDGFPPDLPGFSNAASYQSWRFVYLASK
ncbi:type II secretion system protein [Rugamonas apoptosis]|uniref:Type II secretion system protein n=1 Tax=Rugamonas apoptosis TaxID=2758570 RepID=A0A7W2FE29_9BURK|nr:type II secretion system protein [Rugamonas apoptosis]MBA5689976.1 type II secretion system protein [Rugamonas apoptosis]